MLREIFLVILKNALSKLVLISYLFTRECHKEIIFINVGGWLQLQGCVPPPMDWRRSPLAATTLSSSSSGPTYLCFSSQVPWLPWKWVEEPITVVQWIVINYVWVFVMWVAFIIWKYVFVFLCVLLLCGGCTWSVCCAQYSLLESTIAVWRFALRRVHPLLVPSLPPPPLIHHTDHPHQVTTHDEKIITPLAMMMQMQMCVYDQWSLWCGRKIRVREASAHKFGWFFLLFPNQTGY